MRILLQDAEHSCPVLETEVFQLLRDTGQHDDKGRERRKPEPSQKQNTAEPKQAGAKLKTNSSPGLLFFCSCVPLVLSASCPGGCVPSPPFHRAKPRSERYILQHRL